MNVIMKTFSLLAILLYLPLNLLAQNDDNVWISNDLFSISYDENLEQPVQVVYEVLCPLSGASRTGLNFWEPEGIKTSDDDDYYNNIWDKGHMAPAAAFDCTPEMLKETFNYANAALQHQNLNRGAWRKLEEVERSIAFFYNDSTRDEHILVQIDVLFDETSETLSSGATVPSGFKKTLFFGAKEYTFIFPNEDTKGKRWQDFYVEQDN